MTTIKSNVTPSVYNYVEQMSSQGIKSFGQWLIEQLDRTGLNQSELADRARVSKNYISTLVNDRPNTRGELTQPRLDKVERIARALGVPLNEAKIAAGYYVGDQPSLTDRTRRLLSYFDQLPEPTQDDAIAIIEALWRLHGKPTIFNLIYEDKDDQIMDQPIDPLLPVHEVGDHVSMKRSPKQDHASRKITPGEQADLDMFDAAIEADLTKKE